MQTHELLKGKHCPYCKLTFAESIWGAPGGAPDPETLEDSGFTLFVVCAQCARILCMVLKTGELRVMNPADIESCPPQVLDAVRATQRRIYVLAAREVAMRN